LTNMTDTARLTCALNVFYAATRYSGMRFVCIPFHATGLATKI